MAAVTIDGIPVYRAIADTENLGIERISLVDDPAVQSNFLAFKENKRMTYAVQDEDKHLVLGVVMRADFPIYRREPGMGEFYIIYDAETIRLMAERYLRKGRQNEVNLMHAPGTDVEGVYMVQYFIKGGGISPAGFEDIADGSLFAEFHVHDEELWQEIKAGTFKGFSLEGVFDLEPMQDKAKVEEIVDTLQGLFSRLTNKPENMAKIKGLLARLAKALVELGNVTTDKGILAWDGTDDLKEGDAVYIEDSEGERTPAPDGDYTTEDGKVIAVVSGKVAAINDGEAEVAPETPEEPAETRQAAQTVSTDKGALSWAGDAELKEGDEVFQEDGTPAADGDYTAEDGTVITVTDGKVSAIKEPEPEPETNPEVEAMRSELAAIRSELADLKAAMEKMAKTPAARNAHEEVQASAVRTGNNGLDRLSALMGK